jgi:hypothetical protein
MPYSVTVKTYPLSSNGISGQIPDIRGSLESLGGAALR